MWCIQITGGELSTVSIKNIRVNLFYFFSMKINFALLCIGAFCYSLQRFHVKSHGITLCFKIGLVKCCKRNYISITVTYKVSAYYTCALVKFYPGCIQLVITVFYTCFFSV